MLPGQHPQLEALSTLLSEYKQIEGNRKDQKLGKHHLGLEGKSSVNFKPFTYSFFSLLQLILCYLALISIHILHTDLSTFPFHFLLENQELLNW